LRFRAVGSYLLGTLILAVTPMSALATTGGVSAGGAVAVTTPPAAVGGAAPTSTTPVVKKPHAPIVAKSPSTPYTGPVYEKTATGQVVPYTAPQTPGEVTSATGGSTVGVVADTKPELLVPGSTAREVDNGLAAAPMSAPLAVQEIVWAGNQIVGLPYIYGGGHASFISPGYDCSGTVSYALHGASLIETPMDSSEFEGWDSKGVGTWVTIFANPGHAYMTVAGLRLDTSPANDPSNLPGPRWRPLRPENAGYVVRHPTGL
jgi:cell wall-associated NlpC family hydrolase